MGECRRQRRGNLREASGIHRRAKQPVVGQLQREFVPHPQVIENFDIYPLHVSRDVGRQVLGCDIAVYLEVGYLDGELSISASTPSKCLPP